MLVASTCWFARHPRVGIAILILAACPGGDPATSEGTSTGSTSMGSTSTTTSGGTGEPTTDAVPTTGAVPTTSAVDPTTGSTTTGDLACEPMSVEPCYSGDPKTEGVGPCHAGTRTCDALGAGFGACEGEVVPQVDDCTTPEDEDCDGQLKLCPGEAYWAKRFGEAENQEPGALEVAADGTSVLVGSIQATTDFGLGPIVSKGDYDMFVAKFAADGEPVWVRSIGSVQNQSGAGVAADGTGQIAVVGGFYDTVDFGGGPLTQEGFIDAYVAVFDADGAHVWSKGFGDTAHQIAQDVAVTPADEFVVTGTAAGTTDFGGGPLTSAGSEDHFIVKFTPGGEHVWSKLFGDAGEQSGEPKVEVQASGDIVAAGTFSSTIDFGSGPLPAAGLSDVYLTTLDGDGKAVWAKRFGDAAYQYVNDLDVDPASGRIVIVGAFEGKVDFGGGSLDSAGGLDLFAAVFEADGAPVWSRRFGDGAKQSGMATAFAVNGDILLSGSFDGTLDLGGDPLIGAGGEDMFLARLAADDGTHVRSARFGDTSYQRGYCLGHDGADNVFSAGMFGGTLSLGGIDLVSHGKADIHFSKLAF